MTYRKADSAVCLYHVLSMMSVIRGSKSNQEGKQERNKARQTEQRKQRKEKERLTRQTDAPCQKHPLRVREREGVRNLPPQNTNTPKNRNRDKQYRRVASSGPPTNKRLQARHARHSRRIK
ncbi:hypothetical protein BC567DRAFT_230610 [Phyllosticta citribraziliensis]